MNCDGCGTELTEQGGWLGDERREDVHWCPFCAFRLRKIDATALQWNWTHWHGIAVGSLRPEFSRDGEIVFMRRHRPKAPTTTARRRTAAKRPAPPASGPEGAWPSS